MNTGMMGMLRTTIIGLFVGSAACLAIADTPHPPLEAYGELPSVRDAAISPDGKTIAYIVRKDGKDVIATYDTETGAFAARIAVDDMSTRGIWFPDNNHLLILASEARRVYGVTSKFEYSSAYSLNLETDKTVPLLTTTPYVYRPQTGLGNVVGIAKGSGEVFMPAFMQFSGYDLLKVNLDTGKGKPFATGPENTYSWMVDENGVIIAREEYDSEDDIYRIFSDVSGETKLIYEVEAAVIPFSLVGIKADRTALILVGSEDEYGGYQFVRELDFEGNISGPLLERPGSDVSAYIDRNGVFEGVIYSDGEYPRHFFDPAIEADVRKVVDSFPGSTVSVASRSDSWKQIVYLVQGSDTPGKYVLQDRETGKVTGLLNVYNDIPIDAVAEVLAVSYPARDGLTIPAVLTWPAGVPEDARSGLPLLVMPHGGPGNHDSVGFDWMAQYFANRGYAVLQPNFRGSTGFGSEFKRAGFGEWGGKMQDDITDGVTALIKDGSVDPERICIVGASYGGYAALAGGAFTPDLYKCVVAIAPVSDLPRLLRETEQDSGEDSMALAYWKLTIGDPKKVDLEAVSPVDNAQAFKAPVLLFHGKDDTVVSMNQSRVMQKALKRAGKDVTFIELKGEDHWLSEGTTRIQTLRAMADFVEANIGAR
ncbi:alpha/beta fold hydrolase [Hyphomonas chukchiensis]|nr:alpha/beta fold hydrolase [Hyphomonas chukchiensis]